MTDLWPRREGVGGGSINLNVGKKLSHANDPGGVGGFNLFPGRAKPSQTPRICPTDLQNPNFRKIPKSIRRPLWGHWRVRVSFRHSDLLTLPLPPPAGARGPSNRSVHHHHPPAIFTLGGLGQIFVQQRLPPELPRATGPRQGAHKRTDIFRLFFCRPGVRKVGPLGDWICRLPAPLGGLGQIFVQQRLPPELPRATGPRQGAHKSPNIFTKIRKNREPSSGAKP